MSSLLKQFRFWNVLLQNVLLFAICVIMLHNFANKNTVDSVISPYIYKVNAIKPELSVMKYTVVGTDTQPLWQSYKFQALAESGCLDQQYYNKTAVAAKFQEISADERIWNESTATLSNFTAGNFDKKNPDTVCACIAHISLTDADAVKFYANQQDFKDKINEACYDDNKIPIFFVESFEKVHTVNNDRHFYRFILGINLLLFYAWSLSAKSWADFIEFQGTPNTDTQTTNYDINDPLNKFMNYIVTFVVFIALPVVILVLYGWLIGKCFYFFDWDFTKTNPLDVLILMLVWIGVLFMLAAFFGLSIVLFRGKPPGNSERAIQRYLTESNAFLSAAQLRTTMDYSFVFGGTIALIYASIMSGLTSLASICTVFILGMSLFYSIHVNFYMRNQLDVIMSNLDDGTRGYLFHTGTKTIADGDAEKIEYGLRPFANSIVMTRLTYLMITFSLLLSIVFMARDTPAASGSYILSYQLNWIVLVFLTLCSFSYDFFNEVQQKIIKYTDHDLIVYSVIFISFSIFHLFK
jgi:hypothetical protein